MIIIYENKSKDSECRVAAETDDFSDIAQAGRPYSVDD